MSNFFDKAPWHFGTRFANQTLYWLPPDTKENFECMLQDPQRHEYFTEQEWLNSDTITYQINSQGFRSQEFDSGQSCLIALGCSFTMGMGLPLSRTWPYLLGQQMNLPVYNLAWAGSSADTCYRLARYWIPHLKPSLVAVLAPPRDRIELILDSDNIVRAEVFMPNSNSKHFSNFEMFLKRWWLNDENGIINNEKNLKAIQQLATANGAKFIALLCDEEMIKSREEIGYARDGLHAGPQGHKLVAEKMLQELSWP